MARALLGPLHGERRGLELDQLRAQLVGVFAALAQNPSLIEPMRAAYADLYRARRRRRPAARAR